MIWARAGGGGAPHRRPANNLANWNLLNVDWNIEASLGGTTFDLIAVGDMETVLFGTAYIFEEDSKICDGNNNAGNCDRANTNELDNLDITAMLGISSPLISSEDIPGNALAFESELNDSHNDLESYVRCHIG